MRFRASIENGTTFQRIIQTVERLSKVCLLKFSPTHLRIICDKAGEGGIQVWSVIKVGTLFADYRIQSNANDEITLRISSEPLLQALRSAASSPEVTVKLTKKNDIPLLSFEIMLVTRQNKKQSILHDVQIEVLPPQEVEKLTEPTCPLPDVHIFLPSLSKLRTVTDHMRQLSDVMGIAANGEGHLKIFIETDMVKVVTEWSNCQNPVIARDEEDENEEPTDPKKFATTLVSIKSFLKFLSCHVVSTTTIACICHKHCIIMYVYIGEVGEPGDVLTFYIPAMHDGVEV